MDHARIDRAQIRFRCEAAIYAQDVLVGSATMQMPLRKICQKRATREFYGIVVACLLMVHSRKGKRREKRIRKKCAGCREDVGENEVTHKSMSGRLWCAKCWKESFETMALSDPNGYDGRFAPGMKQKSLELDI